MGEMKKIPELEGKVFEPIGLLNDPYNLNLPNPEITLKKTHTANEYVTEFLQDYSWGVREIMRMSGYNVPTDTIVIPKIDFGIADLPQSIENENGRWTYNGIAMEITGANGQYRVDVNPRMARASKDQFAYKVLHEWTHGLLDAYGLPLKKHSPQVERWIDIHAANALGKPELVETSKYVV